MCPRRACVSGIRAARTGSRDPSAAEDRVTVLSPKGHAACCATMAPFRSHSERMWSLSCVSVFVRRVTPMCHAAMLCVPPRGAQCSGMKWVHRLLSPLRLIILSQPRTAAGRVASALGLPCIFGTGHPRDHRGDTWVLVLDRVKPCVCITNIQSREEWPDHTVMSCRIDSSVLRDVDSYLARADLALGPPRLSISTSAVDGGGLHHKSNWRGS